MSDPFGSGDDRGRDEGWGAPQSSEPRWSDQGSTGQTDAPAAPGWAAPDAPAPGSEAARPADPNVTAIERADLESQWADWLREVARQVDPRLDRVNPEWRASPQAEAARACAFGLLLGQLATMHPHARGALGRVAEIHESFGNLPAGERLPTLEGLAQDGQRATAWIGPLVRVDEPHRVRELFD